MIFDKVIFIVRLNILFKNHSIKIIKNNPHAVRKQLEN